MIGSTYRLPFFLAGMLALQGCLFPADGNGRTDKRPDNLTDNPPEIEYEVTFPGVSDTLAAGSMAHADWTHPGRQSGFVRLSLWKDSTLISDVLGDADADRGSMPWALPWGLDPGPYRLRIASLKAAGTFAFSSAFFIKEAAPDSFEADGSPDLAKPIGADGKPQAHTLGMGDTDWIRFDAGPGKRYAIDFRNNHPLQVDLADGSGRPLAADVRRVNQIGFTPAYAGPHLLRVSPDSSPYGYGPYRISVREYEPSGSPYPIAFSSPSGDSVWNAGRHTLVWTQDSANFGSQADLSLYEDTTFVLFLGFAAGYPGTAQVTLPDHIYSGSRYRIRISPHFPQWQGPFVFAYSPYFAIEARTPDAYEPDDSRETAQRIAADGSVQRHNHAQGDTDWVRFEAEAGRIYLAKATYSYGATYLQLRDSAGSILASTTKGGEPLAYVPPRDGIYFLRIVPNGSGGDYGLRLAAFDASPDGVPLGFTFPAPGAILTADSPYTVTWSPDPAFLSDYMDLALYRGDSSVRDLGTSFLNSGSLPVTLPADLATGADYRLRLGWSGVPSLFGFSPVFSIVGKDPRFP